jgi:hypothetical protein
MKRACFFIKIKKADKDDRKRILGFLSVLALSCQFLSQVKNNLLIKRNNFYYVYRVFIFLIILLPCLFSCRTPRELPTEKIRPVNRDKLLRKIEQNTLKYDDFSISRIFCHFSDSETNANFRISLKAKKDKKILLSISKINIPLGRVLLTPDSLIYVNYLDRNYFIDDYTFLHKLFNIYIDFYTVQSILSNDIFLFAGETGNENYNRFSSSVKEGMYVLKSGDRDKKEYTDGDMNPSVKMNEVYQEMYFNPQNFTLNKYIRYDVKTDRELKIIFDDYVKVKNNEFPGSIEINVISEIEYIQLNIKMNGFSTELDDSINMQIPEKYEQIFFN